MSAAPPLLSRRQALAVTGRAAAALALAPFVPSLPPSWAAGRRASTELRVILVGRGAGHDDATAGAELGAAEAERAASLVGRRFVVSGGGASELPESLRPERDVIVGGGDAEACRRLAARAERAGVVYLNPWSAADALRTPATPPRRVFHVAASDADRRRALVAGLPADALRRRWVALGGDAGTAHAATLLAARGAQVERVRAVTSGGTASHATLAARVRGGDALLVADSATASIEAARRVLAADPAALVASAASLGDVAHLHAAMWDASLERFGGEQLNARYRARVQRPMTEDAWAGWATLKLLADAWLRPDTTTLAAALAGRRPFDANKGRALAFRAADGQLAQPLYVVRVAAGGAREVVAEVNDPGAEQRP